MFISLANDCGSDFHLRPANVILKRLRETYVYRMSSPVNGCLNRRNFKDFSLESWTKYAINAAFHAKGMATRRRSEIL